MYANCKDEGTLKPDNLLAGDFPRVARLVDVTAGNYVRGTVLGKVTASGRYCNAVSTQTDGSQVPLCILAENVNAEKEDKQAVVYFTGEFNSDALTFDNSFTVDVITEKLREKSIFIKKKHLDNAASSQYKTELVYRPYLSTDLTTPQMIPPVRLTVTEISGDVYKITAKARMTDIGNKTFPNETYRLSKFMGLVS